MSTIEIRISGEEPQLQAVFETLARTFTVVKQRGPYPNRKQPGLRRYLDVAVTTPANALTAQEPA